MTYGVVTSPDVQQTIDRCTEYLVQQGAGPDRIQLWLSGIFDLIDELAEFPRRYPVVPTPPGDVDYELRRAVYGDYLLFYSINEGERRVTILTFRHGMRDTEA
jgi:plasmid stabilization system protein ParE